MARIDQDIQQLKKRLTDIAKKELPRAQSSAINKTVAKAQTRVVRGVAKTVKVPQKHVKRKVYIEKSTVRTQKLRFKMYRTEISVISLGAKQNRKGVRAAGRMYRSAFINTLQKSGRPAVLQREGKSRTPIEYLTVPIADAVNDIAEKVVRRVVAADYEKTLKRELEYRVGKYGSK